MLKVAIVGCGRIADAHASQIRRIEGCAMVGVCDREALMARQLCERFEAGRYFDDLEDLLNEVAPDVVHITTPPQSHFEIARVCLERGCHVYVEKPFTLDAQEAEALIELAMARRLSVTAGHDAQFSHPARRLRALVRDGYLGERIVHMESYYGYDLGDPAYARAFLANDSHWVRALPGGLLQNVISHGLARIAEFFEDERPRVIAHGFTSPMLGRLGGEGILDELRVVLAGDSGTTAAFTFSSQMRPVLNQFRIVGSRNGLLLDEHQQTLVRLRGTAFKSHAERFLPPVIFAREYLGNALGNARRFLASDLHMESGKKALIEAFYRSIRAGGAPPIPFREILLTARLMDAIFEQVGRPVTTAGGARC